MTKEEFEDHIKKIINVLGEEAVQFLLMIQKMEAFFLKADEEFTGSPMLLEEFEEIGQSVIDVLGNDDGKRFFKAIWDTLPTQTVWYLYLLVKLFELGENDEDMLKLLKKK